MENDLHNPEDKAALMIIIPSRWVRKWLIFAHLRLGEEPGKIDTKMLLTQDSSALNGWRPLRTLKPPNYEKTLNEQADETPGHYRRIHIEAWKKLEELYGVNGPVIAVNGFPFEDLSRWRCFPTVNDIDTVSALVHFRYMNTFLYI